MKIEFENSIRRLSFLCRLTDIKTAWINPWTSLQTSHNQLKFYQEQSGYDTIALQEINDKEKLEIFKNWKRKFHSTFTDEKLGLV